MLNLTDTTTIRPTLNNRPDAKVTVQRRCGRVKNRKERIKLTGNWILNGIILHTTKLDYCDTIIIFHILLYNSTV